MRSVLGLGVALLCIGLTAAVDIDYVQNPNFENCDAAQNPQFWTASFSEPNEQYGCAITTQLTGAAVSVYSVPTGFLTLQQTVTLIPGLQYTGEGIQAWRYKIYLTFIFIPQYPSIMHTSLLPVQMIAMRTPH